MLAGSKSQALQCTTVTPCSISGLDCPTANRERNGIGSKFQNMRFWFLHNGYRLRKVTLMSWWMLIRSQRCSARRRGTRYQLSFQRVSYEHGQTLNWNMVICSWSWWILPRQLGFRCRMFDWVEVPKLSCHLRNKLTWCLQISNPTTSTDGCVAVTFVRIWCSCETYDYCEYTGIGDSNLWHEHCQNRSDTWLYCLPYWTVTDQQL